MRCSEAQGIVRNLGGGDEMAPDLIRHLEDCAACATVLSEHQQTLAAIKALAWPELDPKLVARLHQPELLRASAGNDRTAQGSRDRDVNPSPPSDARDAAHPARRWRLVEGFAVGLILLAAGWLLSQRLTAVPGATPPQAVTSITGGSATPLPIATRVGDGGRLPEFRGIASQPMELVVDSGWERGDDMKCRRVWIELGDGTEQELYCRADIPPDAYPAFPSDTKYTITHTYAAGTYFPQLRMALEDGTELVNTAAQVIVSSTPPRSLGAELLRLDLLPWALGFIVLGLLWLSFRHTKDRWLGLALALVIGTVLVMALLSVLSPQMFSYLDALRGQVGLDPLDAGSPLADYSVKSIDSAGAYVATFNYANGQTRTYHVAMDRRSSPTRRDGLGRLRTEHRALPGIPFADFEHDGIALDTPERLPAQTEADRRPEAAQNWLEAACVGGAGNLVPAPDGSAFLVALRTVNSTTAVWQVPRNGDHDQLLGTEMFDHQWSPDSRFQVLVMPFPEVGDAPRLVIRESATGSGHELGLVDAQARPGVTADGVWFARSDGLWRMPFVGGTLQRVMAWPSDPRFAPVTHHIGSEPPVTGAGENAASETAAMVRPAPDGNRVAYSCRAGLCFSNIDGSNLASVDGRVSDVSWSPDGEQIAAVEYSGSPRMLWLIDRSGITRRKLAVAPEGAVSPPSWTSDSRRLFLTTCPLDGRRIITVDAADGLVRDLSQPRWDAWAALMPGENALLLSNGRGGYWRAGIRER